MNILMRENNYKKIINNRYGITKSGVIFCLKSGKLKYTWLNQGRSSLYERVQFSINGSKRNFYVHRLVAEFWLDGFDLDFEVNHIDGDTLNNHADNLELCSRSYNAHDAYYRKEAGITRTKVILGSWTVNCNYSKWSSRQKKEAPKE